MHAKVYISGALMASRDLASARAKYESCASILREAGFSPYLPHKLTDPEEMRDVIPSAVFERDMLVLKNSEVVVAFLDEPSLGVGAEIAVCIAEKIPVVAVKNVRSQVSRFIVGMIECGEFASIHDYEDFSDLRGLLPITVRASILESQKKIVSVSSVVSLDRKSRAASK